MKSHSVPGRSWPLISSRGTRDLTTVDYYSRFFEVDELTTTTSAAVIKKLSGHFARHGIPEVVVSDDGPQFAS